MKTSGDYRDFYSMPVTTATGILTCKRLELRVLGFGVRQNGIQWSEIEIRCAGECEHAAKEPPSH